MFLGVAQAHFHFSRKSQFFFSSNAIVCIKFLYIIFTKINENDKNSLNFAIVRLALVQLFVNLFAKDGLMLWKILLKN